MISKAYLKQIIKSNIKIFSLFTFILCLLISVVMKIFDPEMIETVNQASVDLPFNPLGDISSLINFISNQYFGMMSLIIGIIYTILMANKLIVKQVDKGNLVFNLSTPLTRNQITTTSALYLIGSIVLMYFFISLIGILVAEIVQQGELIINTFLQLSVGACLIQLAISSISFCASCIFNTTSKYLLIGGGIPVCFFVIDILSNMSETLQNLKHISLLSLYDRGAIIEGTGTSTSFICLILITIGLYLIGINIFKRKDLSL